jgi:SAM-dependent methyltransferase
MLHTDVEILRDFYATGLGQVVRRQLSSRIRARWPRLDGLTLMGLGFATPFLGGFRGEVLRLGALMPETQGALVWPATGPRLSVLVEDDRLPLPDSCVDRLLVVHGLEATEHARTLLREIWRVLAPDGRVIIIVPNRRGLWARFDRTPLGQGRPYSRGQLETLLQEAMFSNFEWETALYLPPFDKRWLLRWAGAFERVGRRLPAAFGGIVLVEARKETMQALAVPAKPLARRLLVPAHGVATKVSRRHAGSSVE